MNKLILAIEGVRQKLPGLRRHSLKETPTRTIVVDPLLEALGWDVRDPDEVQLEYPTVDGKSVDYALKINRTPVLLVEAKALEDTLDDVKAVTQVVSYAANDGIVWCVLTNGLVWRVYRSIEKCPAPDKMMYEVNLDPNAPEAMDVGQAARQMWRFSQEEMAKGTLDELGEKTFTDGKVRKALQTLMADPPRALLNLVRKATGEENLAPMRIKESLARIAREDGVGEAPAPLPGPERKATPTLDEASRSVAARRTWETRRGSKGTSLYDEAHHLEGRAKEAVSLYQTIDHLCRSLADTGIALRYLKKSINYTTGKRCFCSVHILKSGLRVWLPLKYNHLENPPPFARDVSNIGHWGTGDMELRITNHAELDEAADLIRRSFESAR